MHLLEKFHYCPICGSSHFVVNNNQSKCCKACGFVYYLNPKAAVAAFIVNEGGELLVCRRAKDPALGMLDLPGGFTDCFETAEEAVVREVKEETGLVVNRTHYLFSLPNIYHYSGIDIHTMDLFFECDILSPAGLLAQDDVAESKFVALTDLQLDCFGLSSIRKAVDIYLRLHL